ncbi:putative ATPase family protein [Trypanosoma vivax]|uniref:Putative ATPase n=1 Tax=Trypanosoma vivax (strain Y486) TaxID=1055687 RepID=G0U9W6_TRYVY|nr:putative ATPase [Trypanosoma vivax]KAH8619151.1 putative ATPase family protein [Trypanosoma vivax]CCC52597.1 putative ATPase [Trypanosoma vivax Y486]
MIKVPARWACATSPVALVQVNDGLVAVCSVSPVHNDCVSWELTREVTLTRECAEKLTVQDFSEVEVHHVLLRGEASNKRLRFVEVAARKCEGGDVMRIQTPKRAYVAKTVLLEGPRMNMPGFMESLFAHLVGRYVIPGCHVEGMDGTRYCVKSAELYSGYRGLSLVCGTTRVKLNHKPAGSTCTPSALVGMGDHILELTTVMKAMKNSPGNWIGVCIHEPEDCVAWPLIQECARDVGCVFVQWSPSTAWDRKEGLWDAQLVVLGVPFVDVMFPSFDKVMAGMTARQLRHDISLLTAECSGVRASVVLVGVTASSAVDEVADSLFSMHITVDLPDLHKRAAILAHVRGGDASEYMEEAHKSVGLSSTAMLEVARDFSRAHQLPMKPFYWSEIGGLDEVKRRLRQALIMPRLQPEAFARFNVTPPRGVLLYGPPGCAKTSLVKALCSEGYFSFIYLDSASLISAYVGESERQLREVFRKAARRAPCIVFFDEVEVIGGRRRAGSRDGDHARLLSTLLTEMDGFSTSCGVCFVGATNAPHLLDSALLRPGRFDYHIYVPLPSKQDRRCILEIALGSTSADIERLAEVTEGFSGADLSALSSGVLLELLEGQDEHSAQLLLKDPQVLMKRLIDAAKIFQKTNYDVAALEKFHQDCSSF